MDLSSFSNSDFDACAWINSQLEEVPHGETTETHLSSLAMKLHLASSEYAEQLETAMVESMSTMPRMVAEVSRLEDQLQVIRHEMRKLSEHINAVDKRSIAGVEELSRLDGLKASMEVCRSTLEEHARWSQLVREARQLLENGGTLSETADRIETMFRSLDVLREMPGHAERQEACVSYRSSLLAALLPSIRSQLTSSTAEEVEGTGGSLREYLYVFRKLGREEQFEGEYLSCRPAPLLHTWASTTEGVQQHKQSLSAALAHYLGSVSSFLADEEAAAAALFGTTRSRRLLTQLLAAALQPMRGEMAELLREADDVAVIAECSGVLDEFCKRLLGRATARDRGSDREVREAVLSGCWAAQAQYVDCEDRHLRGVMATAMASVRFRCAASALDDEEVDEGVLDEGGDPVELLSGFADALLPALDGVFREVAAGLCRCCQFMAGAALKAHCRALAAALQHLSKLLTMKMECLAQACGISSGSSSADMSSASSSGDEARTAASIAARLQAEDCDKAGVMACALRALQAAGRYKRHLADVEAQLKACCAAVLSALLQAEDEEENEEVASADAPSAAYCAQLLRADGNLLAETKAFLSQGSSMAAALAAFPRKQATQAGQALLGLCVDPLSRQLDGYRCSSSEDVIINTGIEEEEEEVSVLQERLLPQAVVTMIGETMLAWVQDLDAFASSDALVDLLVLRGEASALCPSSCGWRALASKLDLKDDKALAQLASKALAAKGLQAYEREVLQTARAQGITAWASAAAAAVGDDSSAEDDPGSGTAGHTGFVNEWLAVIADSIVGIFLAHLLDMRDAPLSVGARAQLMVDADYLRNVMSATGLRCHPLLLRAFQLAKESPESTGKLLRSLSAGKSLGSLRDLLALDLALAAAIHGTLVN